ncbi:MAG: hypothetical protein ACI4QE_00845 [Acutalibacteraceae bacterium]
MMNIYSFAENAIKKYGNKIRLWNRDKYIVSKAFIEPLRYKTQKYLGGKSLPSEFYDDGHYLYIGLPENTLDEDTTVIEHKGRNYFVRRSEIYCVGDREIYTWAVLKPYFGKAEEYDEIA